MADITMPQLGETVTEGTITRWFKQVGDKVAEDEALFEVSTDKVDSEVPAAAAGYLTEILVKEGETVDVGAKLAVIPTSRRRRRRGRVRRRGNGGGGASRWPSAEPPRRSGRRRRAEPRPRRAGARGRAAAPSRGRRPSRRPSRTASRAARPRRQAAAAPASPGRRPAAATAPARRTGPGGCCRPSSAG